MISAFRSTATWSGIVLALMSAPVIGAVPDDAPPPKSPFEGKVLLITTAGVGYGAVLEKVEVKQVGNLTFLVGRYPKADFLESYSGKTAWISANKILQIVEYENVEEVRKIYSDAFDGAGKGYDSGKLN